MTLYEPALMHASNWGRKVIRKSLSDTWHVHTPHTHVL